MLKLSYLHFKTTFGPFLKIDFIASFLEHFMIVYDAVDYLYLLWKLSLQNEALVLIGIGFLSHLVHHVISHWEFSSLGLKLIWKVFKSPFIVWNFLCLSLHQLLMIDNQIFNLCLEPIVLGSEDWSLLGLLCDLFMTPVHLLLSLLPSPGHDHVVAPCLIELFI